MKPFYLHLHLRVYIHLIHTSAFVFLGKQLQKQNLWVKTCAYYLFLLARLFSRKAVLVNILFFFFLTSLLKYNCLTIVCQLLLYNKVNQLYIYNMFPFLFRLASPSLPPSPSHPSRWSQSTELISLCYAAASHQLSILHLVVYICP